MKLYKFRSLENFDRIVDILVNKKFYLSKWSDLNDPMEGYFHHIIYDTDIIYKDKIKQFINNKNELRICSFANTVSPILLWTHYANQHKGIAIEVTLNPKNYINLYKVRYGKNIPTLHFDLDTNPYDVLKSKIKHWSYEKEYRIIDRANFLSLGDITGVYFGIKTDDYQKGIIKNLLLGSSIKTYETKIDFENNAIVVTEN